MLIVTPTKGRVERQDSLGKLAEMPVAFARSLRQDAPFGQVRTCGDVVGAWIDPVALGSGTSEKQGEGLMQFFQREDMQQRAEEDRLLRRAL